MNSTAQPRSRRLSGGKPDANARPGGGGSARASNASKASKASKGGRQSGRAPARSSPSPEAAFDRAASSAGWMSVLEATVQGLGYDLVEVERLPRGLLRVSIDRVPGRAYPVESEFVTVDDCETVTRQLQLVFEVENVDYDRLEVSSPGLDRPLRHAQDWDRFCGLEVDVTFKAPFQGRRKFRGLLLQAQPQPRLVVKEGKTEQALDFTLDEVREARLVPVVDFKGRMKAARNGEQKT
jgi:ribosome maturation factor RimP